MKVLDRYLVRELLVPIFYSAAALVFLVLIADLFDNLDDLLHHDTPFPIIVRYYLSLIPYVFMQILPWACWIGTLFLLVNLGMHNEITAMKIAGLKIPTIIRPILFLGFLIGILSFLISDRLVPWTYHIATDLRLTHIEKIKNQNARKVIPNVTYFAEGNRLYYFREFMPNKGMVEDAIVLWFDQLERNTREKMIAKRGIWKDGAWKFEDITEYQMDSRGRILGEPKNYPEKIYPEINVAPRDLMHASSDANFLSYRDLENSIRKLKENGVHVYSEKVELHYRLAAPWQGLIMMLTTIPLLGRTSTRKVIAVNVLICVLLVFAYYVTGAVGLALGKAGKVFPFFSAWLSNIVFSIGALVYLEKANY